MPSAAPLSEKGSILIKGARVLTPDGDPHVPAIRDILIEDGLIARIASGIEAPSGTDIIDASSPSAAVRRSARGPCWARWNACARA